MSDPSLLTANSCSKTVTARVARVEFLKAQFRATGFFILQLVQSLLRLYCSEKNIDVHLEDPTFCRDILFNMKDDLVCYNNFYTKLITKYPSINEIILLLEDAHTSLIGLKEFVQTMSEPINELWNYCLKTCYSKPFLLRDEDDAEGKATTIFRQAMVDFVPENVKFQFNKTQKEARMEITEEILNTSTIPTTTTPKTTTDEPKLKELPVASNSIQTAKTEEQSKLPVITLKF